jgi:hypothetical protein
MTAPAANRLAGHGLAVGLPARWEGRIYRRVVTQDGAGRAS